MARRRRMLWLAVVVLIGACGQGGNSPGETVRSGDDPERLRQQARDALARYDQAVGDAGGSQGFVPVGDLTIELGKPANGDEHGQLTSRRFVAATVLPAAPQPTGNVVWDNGASQTLPLLSADEALKQLVAAGAGACPECAPVEVTGARLTTLRIQTTRGQATVPVWEFTLKTVSVGVARVAVDNSAIVKVTPPSWDPYNTPPGMSIESATTTTSSRQLTVAFTGSPGPASRPCGADYSAEAVESANAVVVIIIEHRHPGDRTCTAIGAARTATVDLAQPLGERAVLEVRQGIPVPVTITA